MNIHFVENFEEKKTLNDYRHYRRRNLNESLNGQCRGEKFCFPRKVLIIVRFDK